MADALTHTEQNTRRCDYLIVGGGTAGAVLASRLSEDGSKTVILLEAGGDVDPDAPPPDVANLFPLSTFNSGYSWPGLKARMVSTHHQDPVPFQQGRVMGGGSTVMGMWALRGVPEDYDGWERDGANGWNWNAVLPYFKKLETDHDFNGELHGHDGPLPIRRQQRDAWSPLAHAFADAARQAGFTDIEDMNADFADGHGVLPISRYENRRASAGLCYLSASARARSNLQVLAGHEVLRLCLKGQAVIGVVARDTDGRSLTFTAQRTILTAGAIFSPWLLLRSGIGPGAQLRTAGIDVHCDRPGVGRNLQNHPLLPMTAFLKPRGRHKGLGHPPASTFLRWSSGQSDSHRADMGMYIRSYLVWHALGRHLALVGPVLMQQKARGTVRLDAQQPDALPLIDFNGLGHESDLERMRDGVRRLSGFFQSGALDSVCGEPFLLVNVARLQRYNRLSRTNAASAKTLSVLLDHAPAIGNRVFASQAETLSLGSILKNDDTLTDAILANVTMTNHVCGTCRMGPSEDQGAVVDCEGNFHGLAGLTIADASIMPSVPSANTHLPTIMVAEKIAAGLQARGLNA